MRKAALVALLFACLASMSGCKLSMQVEHRAYVISLGLEKNEAQQIVITAQLPTISSSSGEGGGSGGSGESYVIESATAESFQEALALLMATTPRQLQLTHIKSIVVSQSLASSGEFSELANELARTYQMVGSAQLIICAGSAKAFLEAQKPDIGNRLSTTMVAMLENYRDLGYIPNAQFSLVNQLANSFYSDPVAVLAATADEKSFRDAQPGRVGAMYPGSLPRTGFAKNEYMGAALMRDGAMVGALNGLETQFLNVLDGDITSMAYFADDKSLRLNFDQRPWVKIDISSQRPVIDVSLKISVTANEAPPDKENVRAAIKRDLESLIETCQLLKVEPFGFAYVAARNFPNIPEFRAYNWREKFVNAQTRVNVDIIIL